MGQSNKPESKDDSPPPYSQIGTPPPIVSFPQQASSPAQQIQRQFPLAFNVYSTPRLTNKKVTIGEHQSQPLYAVSPSQSWSNTPAVVLHSGPIETAPPLATAGYASLEAGTKTITFPGSGQPAAEERLQRQGKHKFVWTFSIEAGPGRRREAFEWRHSSCPAVRDLGGSNFGLKLVRLATDAPAGVPGPTFQKGCTTSSDGKEVVAVWATGGLSLSKAVMFRFLGSGASGALGERWALMAVITALSIWDHDYQLRTRAIVHTPRG
ncbi:hypothetical protein F4819DRAFT_17591 [Hypoxylon fuscum]|nr:hypothetical protein F4819DRAFT_17591 [Hypoxylon fuscum]